ncbi:uncharacterized protein [Diadema setosum]|uniref:uncharacterized protein n=1 Tax=Diadema setosum TaxID=31175 RepID=UPI003B3B90B2
MSTITDARRYPSGHCWSRKPRPLQADNMSPNFSKNNIPLLPNNNSRQCRRGDREQHFQQDETVDISHHYNKQQQNIRPSYLRLDSCGENSSAGSGSDEMEVSPGLSSRDRKSPHSRQNSWSRRSRRSQPEIRASEMQQSNCANGLFDRVRTMFSEFEKPHHQRSRTGMNFVRWEEHSADSRLVDLDSVAAKFTNLSCDMMSGNQCNTYQNMDGAYPPKWINNQGYANHHPQQRNPPPFFHPYFSENFNYQPSLISATQNYKRTYYQPWNPYMNRPGPFTDYSQRGFNNQRDQPVRWQQHPQFPRQPWLMPHVRMMQGQYNREPSVQLYPQERHRQPHFQKYQKHRRNSQRDKRKHSKTEASQRNNNCSSSSSDNVQTAHSRSRDQSDSQKLEADQNGGVTHTVNSEPPVASNSPQEAKACGEPEDLKSAIQSVCAEVASVATEQTSQCEQVQTSEERESNSAETRTVEPRPNESNASVPSSRHSSINLILADYESSSVVHPSEDSDFSDANSDLSADENVDLWDSFCVNDPYDPLRGWSCTPVSSTPSCLRQMTVESHVDSGTDEGDVLTDSEDEDDDSDNVDGSVEAGSASCHASGLDQTGPLKLSMPQLQIACKNFSSTPKQASGATSPIHPSVAFILGSAASSDDEDEDDEEWDTLDDSCNLHDDLLWNSFHKARDPYSPMEAWKHNDSILSSTEQLKTNSNIPTTDEHHNSLCNLLKVVATAEKASSSSPNSASDKTPTFEIPTVCLYSSKDDIDCPSGSPLPDGVGMKRTASTSCLKKAQLSPQLRAQKKVRFCADSSFIVLVEKDSPPAQASDSDPPDWQTCARDRMRFQSRIAEVAQVLDPVLAPAHRMQVYPSRFPPNEVSQT